MKIDQNYVRAETDSNRSYTIIVCVWQTTEYGAPVDLFWRGIPKYLGENLSHYHSVHHTPYMNWLVFEPGPPRWHANINRLSYGMPFITVFKTANIFEQRNCSGSLTVSW